MILHFSYGMRLFDAEKWSELMDALSESYYFHNSLCDDRLYNAALEKKWAELHGFANDLYYQKDNRENWDFYKENFAHIPDLKPVQVSREGFMQALGEWMEIVTMLNDEEYYKEADKKTKAIAARNRKAAQSRSANNRARDEQVFDRYTKLKFRHTSWSDSQIFQVIADEWESYIDAEPKGIATIRRIINNK